MVRRTGSFVFFFFALVPGSAAFGQAAGQSSPQTSQVAAAVPVDPVMPKDANAAMQLAARVNGLAGMDMKPWHLKANYQTFDADGKPKDQGVFEEWWAGPDKYKVSYASAAFNQVEYWTGKDAQVTGDSNRPPAAEEMIESLLLHPLPAESAVAAQKYISSDAKSGALAMKCMRPDMPGGYVAPAAYSFGTDAPAIRIEVSYGQFMTFFNGIVTVAGQYVAKEIQVLRASKAYLKVDVMALDFPTKIDASDFVAPASATALPPRRIAVAAGVIAGSLISGIQPEYPMNAKAAHVQGTVVLHAIINKKGEIDHLRVISGPAMLVQAAMDSVYTWRYRPYLLNGVPVEVETQINVVFTLGKR